MNRPTVAMVTDVPFWRRAGGAGARVAALVDGLSRDVTLLVLMLPPERFARLDRQRLSLLAQRLASSGDVTLHLLPGRDRTTAGPVIRRIFNDWRPSACLIEFLRLDWVREWLPAGVHTLLDTHDLVSERHASAEAVGAKPAGRPMSLDEERRAFESYDHVLLIQQDNHSLIAASLGSRVLLVPHPVVLPQCSIRHRATQIGLVASAYVPNVQGLTWFQDHVWPRLQGQELVLNVFGSVGARVGGTLAPGIVRRGHEPSLERIYRFLDIVINPVPWGAGLKIKNVEALMSGLPLVTTSEGARGLGDGVGSAFLVADTAEDFSAILSRLVNEPDYRVTLGQEARQFARARFMPDTCLRELRTVLTGL